MPESRNRARHRHPYHPHHPAANTHHPKKVKRSAAFVVAVVVAILGAAVAFFTQGTDTFWLLTGAASGALIGYIIGRSMDKSIEKK
jgi:hypothetical protein